ncbi:hypothetical protein RSAG8_01579, partial [Rhizoctonia solani AG-8 WAC10335]
MIVSCLGASSDERRATLYSLPSRALVCCMRGTTRWRG